MNTGKRILSKVKDEETLSFDEEIVGVTRMGRNDGERVRPMSVILRSQSAAEQILEKTFRLKENEEFRDVFIKQSLNEEERAKPKELKQEKRKN